MSGFASALLEARRARPRVALGVLDGHPRTVAAGVAAQVELAGLLDARQPAGFKIGATAAAMQLYLGLEGPAAGFMSESSLHGDGSVMAWGRFFRPGCECEIAVQLGRDLPPGECTAAEARDAVEAVMPAIEIVENRYADLATFGAPALIADQVFHAAAVLGAPLATWREQDLLSVRGSMSVDGTIRGEGFGRDLLGGPFDALAWLARSAEAAAFGGLQAGQIVMLGSVCTPVWLDAPGRIEASFDALGIVRVDLVSSGP
ncbi:MAG: fumarylacetoacetate hydrolase family protein [Acetobacteraceae bacterium]|nr:fumarylacetoacetate hydrolase family protein [Acetobacteraceae bacterium]